MLTVSVPSQLSRHRKPSSRFAMSCRSTAVMRWPCLAIELSDQPPSHTRRTCPSDGPCKNPLGGHRDLPADGHPDVEQAAVSVADRRPEDGPLAVWRLDHRWRPRAHRATDLRASRGASASPIDESGKRALSAADPRVCVAPLEFVAVTDDVLPSRRDDRGCEYCADDRNMFYGHVEQISSNEERATLLLRCPRCGWLYETSLRGTAEAQHLSVREARGLFSF